jgi:hypothetical protein
MHFCVNDLKRGHMKMTKNIARYRRQMLTLNAEPFKKIK